MALEDYRGHAVLLVFIDPACGHYVEMAPRLEQIHRATPALQILVVSRGTVEANRKKIEEHNLTFPLLIQDGWNVSRDYAISTTPIAYLIDAAGIITSEAARGPDAIFELATSVHALTSAGSERLSVSHINVRLLELRAEYRKGEQEIQRLVTQETLLRETMLRITGAIQILEELLSESNTSKGAIPSSGGMEDASQLTNNPAQRS